MNSQLSGNVVLAQELVEEAEGKVLRQGRERDQLIVQCADLESRVQGLGLRVASGQGKTASHERPQLEATVRSLRPQLDSAGGSGKPLEEAIERAGRQSFKEVRPVPPPQAPLSEASKRSTHYNDMLITL